MNDLPIQSVASSRLLLAIDPGKDKCGLALIDRQGELVSRQIVAASRAIETIVALLESHRDAQILIGNSTTSRAMRAKLSLALPNSSIVEVEEKNSTLEARALYWRENPPRGWRRVLPLSLQEPPEPVDDFAAVVLVRRFLQSLRNPD